MTIQIKDRANKLYQVVLDDENFHRWRGMNEPNHSYLYYTGMYIVIPGSCVVIGWKSYPESLRYELLKVLTLEEKVYVATVKLGI